MDGGTPALCPMVCLLEAAEAASLKGRPAAIGAFNVNFYSQAAGILKGLRRAKAPGILQASKGANEFQGGPDQIARMVRAAMESSGHKLPVALHLDHGNEEKARQCVDSGYTSVMIDASSLPYEENLKLTRSVAQYAHARGASVEGEYGELAGIEEDIEHADTTYADPFLVPHFFHKTGVDALAIAYGTSHGPNKGADISKLAIHIVQRSYNGMKAYGLNRRCFLVGHGSSTVPKRLVARINRYGGQIREAQGVPMAKIQAAIRAGIRKLNIDTDLRLGITAVFRQYFHDRPGVERTSPVLEAIKQALDARPEAIDPRKYLDPVDRDLLRRDPRGTPLEEVMALVEEQIAGHVEELVHQFGSAGLAGKVKPVSLEAMARRYAS